MLIFVVSPSRHLCMLQIVTFLMQLLPRCKATLLSSSRWNDKHAWHKFCQGFRTEGLHTLYWIFCILRTQIKCNYEVNLKTVKTSWWVPTVLKWSSYKVQVFNNTRYSYFPELSYPPSLLDSLPVFEVHQRANFAVNSQLNSFTASPAMAFLTINFWWQWCIVHVKSTALMKRLQPSPPVMQPTKLYICFHLSFNSHINKL